MVDAPRPDPVFLTVVIAVFSLLLLFSVWRLVRGVRRREPGQRTVARLLYMAAVGTLLYNRTVDLLEGRMPGAVSEGILVVALIVVSQILWHLAPRPAERRPSHSDAGLR